MSETRIAILTSLIKEVHKEKLLKIMCRYNPEIEKLRKEIRKDE